MIDIERFIVALRNEFESQSKKEAVKAIEKVIGEQGSKKHEYVSA